MPLVTSTEMFKKAYDGGYAIGAFNVNNMEIVQGITEACQEERAPVILQVSKGARAYANHTYLVKLVEAAVLELPNVTAELYGGLLADFATERKATAIVRGIRTQSDFDTEYQQAMVNRGLHPGLETLLLPADPAYIYLSSTVAREMIHYHQPLDKYLPKAILPLIRDWTEQR